MKTIALTFAIVALAILSNQCAPDAGVLNRPSNGPTPSPAPNISAEDEARRRRSLQFAVEITQSAIKRESLQLKIGNLKDSQSKGGKEIRMWVGFGILVSRTFIMRELDGKQEALFITAKPGNRKGEITMAKFPLAPPKSGWNEFAEFLRNHGIDSPLKLSLDERHEPDPDEEAIAIEVKSDAGYELVFYLLSSKTENARKAFDVCQKIEQEFGIQMGCQY